MKVIFTKPLTIASRALLALCSIALFSPVKAHEDVTFTTWTGPYMRSQMLGFVNPYQQQTGKKVNVAHYAGGLKEIRDQVESANVSWDVVDLTQADSLRGCNEGLLEKLDHSTLPNGVDGKDYQNDFIDGALNPCGVGVIVWATVFAYDNAVFTDETPISIDDFFDLKKFPGRRGLRKDPSVLLEWALIADGVASEDIYVTLETPEGLDRAFAKLDLIKSHIVWWDKGRQPIRMLNNAEVTMSSIWATTGVEGSKEEDSHFDVNWDGRVVEMDLFGIVKGSNNIDAAMDFIRFASSSESMANQAKYLANGPTRKSALTLISNEIKANLPNGEARRAARSILSNADWWAENYAPIAERFNVWVEQATVKGAAGTVR